MTPFTIRPSTEDERGIAFTTWWRQMANLRPPQTPMGLWRRGCQELVESVLRRSNVLVAVPRGEDDHVVGVVCYAPALLHFVYVKYPVRRFKIATHLLRDAVNGSERIRFTTMPRPRFMGLLQPQWSFDPFAGTRLHLGTGPFQETKP
jgi:hypothetical protein